MVFPADISIIHCKGHVVAEYASFVRADTSPGLGSALAWLCLAFALTLLVALARPWLGFGLLACWLGGWRAGWLAGWLVGG